METVKIKTVRKGKNSLYAITNNGLFFFSKTSILFNKPMDLLNKELQNKIYNLVLNDSKQIISIKKPKFDKVICQIIKSDENGILTVSKTKKELNNNFLRLKALKRVKFESLKKAFKTAGESSKKKILKEWSETKELIQNQIKFLSLSDKIQGEENANYEIKKSYINGISEISEIQKLEFADEFGEEEKEDKDRAALIADGLYWIETEEEKEADIAQCDRVNKKGKVLYDTIKEEEEKKEENIKEADLNSAEFAICRAGLSRIAFKKAFLIQENNFLVSRRELEKALAKEIPSLRTRRTASEMLKATTKTTATHYTPLCSSGKKLTREFGSFSSETMKFYK